MKIGIDIRSTLKRNTGIGRYTFNLVNSLAQIDSQNTYYLYSRKRFLDFKKRLIKLPAKNFKHACDYFKKGPESVLPDLDVFHTSSYDLGRPKRAKKFIVTVHDVIIKAYPFGHSEKTIKEIDVQLKRTLSEADLLIADSYNTKSDIIKFYNVPDLKIHVVYPGIAKQGFVQKHAGAEKRSFAQSYILFVGTIEPRKNIQGIIKAFNRLKKEYGISHKLVIAGMKGWMYEDIFREYENSDFKKDIIFKDYVSDQKLVDLYKNASVFVYPSFYEGFGFPIVEAFSYGIPVVTSSTSSCKEIGRDAAVLVNPNDDKEIGEAIYKIINNNELKKDLIEKGYARAEDFNWQNTAWEFLGIVGIVC